MAKRKRDHGATKSLETTNGHAPKKVVKPDIGLKGHSKKPEPISGDPKVHSNGSDGVAQDTHASSKQATFAATKATNKASSKIAKTENHIDVKTITPTIQIITGSYERVLHGITVNLQLDEQAFSAKYSDSFLFNAHASAIRCLALSPMPPDSTQGIYLATGGSDERINIYSLSPSPLPDSDSKGRTVPIIPSLGPNQISENPMNRELGTLVQHSSTVTALHFPSRSKLLSASEDNTISITRIRDLNVVSTIKAPKPRAPGQASGDSTAMSTTPSGVNDFAIHPSMKLMVSVGQGEKCMRLWNLVTGKKAGVLNFDRKILQAVKESKYSHGEGRKIVWNKEGTEFVVSFERGAVVFGQDSKAKCVLLPQPMTKVHQINYFSTGDGQEFLAVSTEDGRIVFYDARQSTATDADDEIPALAPVAYTGGKQMSITSRVKDFQILDLAKHGFEGQLIAIGCSDGAVRLIVIKDSELLKAKKVDSFVGRTCTDTHSTGSRITCLQAFVMLPPHDIEGGLSEGESMLGSEVESDESSD
ncbi:Protein mak11 [Neophaeococcomyces mojaviensis]|uniref:Protein mak11 n=1 Tax=Neophaeococcomyces mojaviensis TaxID=3383035 RepID=A0ACC2ZTY1_9EURO|nr:Protein mak11 [Knufia sp. JES_112]